MNIRAIVSVVALVTAVSPVPLTAQDHPIPAKDAAARMTLPEGFHATLFAGEPDVVQPIAFAIDDRGRLWVAECYSYPKWHKDPRDGKDRILIFEDTDGDGHFDKRTVFADRLSNLSGIQLGFGGVWLCSTPNLLFIPIKDGEDAPAGPPQVVLDGWDLLKAQHNVFNGLTWGPDGWLYGCNGIQSHSKVGAPGTPDKDRVALNCGVWRYHPLTKKFEAVAHGTTNPWGLDFDAYGEMFVTNCVIEHLFHVVPGGHYKRMYGQDINPHSYGLLESCADHIHWAGGNWTESRGGHGEHGDAGGGHAHVGCMVYLGDNWPAPYRGGVFMCNLHGNRINHDVFERKGSSYVARHGKDFLFANDPWFRGLALQYGPDGGVYLTDWTDTGECHNYQVADNTNGRIYKITYGKTQHKAEDLARLSDMELAQRQLHPNEWHARHARRLLQERAAVRKLDPPVVNALRAILQENPDETRKLRALWTLHAIGGLDPLGVFVLQQLESPSEHVRAWMVRLLLDSGKAANHTQRLARLGQEDPSPVVRLALASGLQRLRLGERLHVAGPLLARYEDAHDAMIPLMLWYGIEPVVELHRESPGMLLAGSLYRCRIPLVREYLARRVTSLGTKSYGFEALVSRLQTDSDPWMQRDILRGMQAALSGQRDVAVPAWQRTLPILLASPLAEVRERTLALGVTFGDDRAWQRVREMALDRKAAATTRRFALDTLIFKNKREIIPVLQQLIDDPVLRGQAVRALAAYDDAETPARLLKRYTDWSDEDKADALQTLTSRPRFALALLDAVAAKQVSRADVSAFTIRQMLALKNPQVTERVEQVWGKIRSPARDKTAVIARYKAALTPAALKKANLATGRALFVKNCASCHRLFGEGGNIGPELTGSQRANLDYVLENLVDPSAIVAREYQVSVVVTTSGRVLTGIIKAESPQAITVQTQNEQVVVPQSEVDSRTVSPLSMMPEGLLDPLRIDEVRDLVTYLASPVQVPLPGQKR
jgi:putative membrane-bound dehydrogenase-like protein